MNTTYQQALIGAFIHAKFRRLDDWPFKSSAEITAYLVRNDLSIKNGEYLVVDLGSVENRISKLAAFEELASVSAEAKLVPYHELERAFYEQHRESIELQLL
jgi:hypothetical protein